MKAFLLVLCWSIIHSPLCYGSPAYPGSQVVLGGDFKNAAQDSATELLSDAKEAMLKGKTNMQKWFYGGKQFIKQNSLLC